VDEHKIGPRHRGWDRGTAKHCRRRPQSSCRKSGNWDRHRPRRQTAATLAVLHVISIRRRGQPTWNSVCNR